MHRAFRSPGRVLALLRRKAYFELIERVAEALHVTTQDDAQTRRQYAQGLTEQGQITAALCVLEGLIDRTADDSEEDAEARGLLGRAYKQLCVEAASADPRTRSPARTRLHLQRSMDAYAGVYLDAPATHLWHGINAVAVAARAGRLRDRVSRPWRRPGAEIRC